MPEAAELGTLCILVPNDVCYRGAPHVNNTWPGNEAILYPALFPGTQKSEGAPDTLFMHVQSLLGNG